MSDRLIGIISFWLAAAVPVGGLFYMNKVFGPWWFFYGLLIYVLVYRPLLHIFRLLSLDAIERKNAWKLFIPFYQSKYFKKLWLG